MAGAMGSDDARSHTTVVSRWSVMPTPATDAAATPLRRNASTAVCRWDSQISSGSSSTHPGRGYSEWISRCALPSTRPSRAITSARELVVP